MRIDTAVIAADSRGWLDRALEVLRASGLVAFPTDTVYGVGTGATDAEGVRRVYQAKVRPQDKPLPVLVASWEQARPLLDPSPGAARIAGAFWPGPVTLVVRSSVDLPGVTGPDGTIGVRAPDHPIALALLQAAGALATTSANLSGAESPRTAEAVLAGLRGRIDLVIDGGACPGGVPSTVVDCTQDEPRILRPGPVGLQALRAAWGGSD